MDDIELTADMDALKRTIILASVAPADTPEEIAQAVYKS